MDSAARNVIRENTKYSQTDLEHRFPRESPDGDR